MPAQNPLNYNAAVRDFKRARKQAAVQQLLVRLTGKSADLLAYDHIRQQLKETGTTEKGLQEVPLKAIVGTVGRQDDFTREFLPKKDSGQERWARVKTAVLDMRGMDPIDVYQIGEAYFVVDGHHRVSVAMQLGTPTISAHVVEVETEVPLALDDDQDMIHCKAHYVDFLEETKLKQWRPDADLLLTFCDHYHVLLAQIETHRQRLAEEQGCAISIHEAITEWYDQIYRPVVDIIRQQGVLHDFPERTEADLYLLFVEHRQELVQALGWHVDAEATLTDLVQHKGHAPSSPIEWLNLQLYRMLVPDDLEMGPVPGLWRQARQMRGEDEALFSDILVGVQKEKAKWRALDQAMIIANRENGRLFGLHVVPDIDSDHSQVIGAIRSVFERQCQETDLQGELTVEVGDVADTLLKRAAWADLVVVRLPRPPREKPLTKFSAGFNRLVQSCPRPLLIMPSGAYSSLDRVLLAYDGSPKAHEALFVAAYMACRWSVSLSVVTVGSSRRASDALQQAKDYLIEHGLDNVTYLLRPKPTADAILATAEAQGSNLLIMGGFGFRPVLQLVLGSTVNQILHQFQYPVLICR